MTNDERAPEQQAGPRATGDDRGFGRSANQAPRSDVTSFHVTSSREDGRVVLVVEGEVDTFTSARLREALNEALDTGAQEIALDLAEMELIDSTGLGVLVGALKKLREREGAMVLRSPTPAVMRVLSIVGLTTYFTIEE